MRLKECAVAFSLSLSLVSRREEDCKEEEGFHCSSSRIGLLRFLLSRERRLKEKR